MLTSFFTQVHLHRSQKTVPKIPKRETLDCRSTRDALQGCLFGRSSHLEKEENLEREKKLTPKPIVNQRRKMILRQQSESCPKRRLLFYKSKVTNVNLHSAPITC